MADPRIAVRSPVDGLLPISGPHFSLALAAPANRFVFRGDEPARAACSDAFEVELPRALGQAGVKDGRTAIWLGPDEWLMAAEGVDGEIIAVEIEAALGATPHSLVDVSHRQLRLDLTGTAAARALSAGCPIDLRESRFPAGAATRTIFDRAEIVLHRVATSAFRIEVWRSFAPYVAAALKEAARGAEFLR